jgi:hypothetical protein
VEEEEESKQSEVVGEVTEVGSGKREKEEF